MRSFRSFLLVLLALAPTLLTGCRKDEIESYEAQREERQPLFPEKPTTRLLGAIVPQDENTWFFKLVGPVETLDEVRGEFFTYLRSVRITGEKATWTLPKGWSEESGPESRFATLRLGPEGKKLELTVTRLGAAPETRSLVANVNRWRKNDLGLTRPLHKSDLGPVIKPETIGGLEFSVVELSGFHVAKSPMMRRPSAPGGPGPAPAPQAPSGGLRYTPPPGWQQVSGDTGFVKAEAAFRITGDEGRADVTITFAGGDFASNVNRWRDQVGLPAVALAELRKETRSLTVDGNPAEMVDLLGPAIGARRDRILGVIVPRGGMSMFIKMRGPAALLERQKTAFEQFVASIRLDSERKP